MSNVNSRDWKPVSEDRYFWGKGQLCFYVPFSVQSKEQVQEEENDVKKEEVWGRQPPNQASSISVEIAAIIFTQRQPLCQSLQYLLITIECAYFDSFYLFFFFLVVDQKYGPIWRQCTTWCVSWPFQSGVTTAVGGALKKMSISYKSSTNKHYVFLLWVPGHSSKLSNNVHS